MTERQVPRWRAIIPSVASWPRLLVAPSSYLLVLSLIATMVAKWMTLRRIDDLDFMVGRWITTCSADVAVFLGFACVFALGESVRRWIAAITIPLSLLITIVALLNAGYLTISGEQMSWPVLTLGLDRFGDVQSILGATVPINPVLAILVAILVVAPPIAMVIVLRKRGHTTRPLDTAKLRARATALPAVLALFAHLAIPIPREYGISKLQSNAVMRTYWGLVTGAGTWRGERGLFAGYHPREMVTAETAAALRAGPHPNIVVVVLESTRRDVTSLPGATGRAKTPTLEALAARGLEMTHARAVIPQTSKSMWSMMCGRLPLMQYQLYENTNTIDIECLPSLLQANGWRTFFIQSAEGKFEDRPRLVGQLGFAEFLAMNHITSELLGYVASDEATLVDPIAQWLDRVPDQPFFLMVLTSSTHHPYDLSPSQLQRAKERGLPVDKEIDKYARQLESADTMIASVIDLLRARGKLDNTIIAVLGDHGEGFGDKGTSQHGANFYEEGLRVPWVIAGPGVPHRTIDGNTIVVDLAPTLLQLLHEKMRPDIETPAVPLVEAPPPERILPFTCFYDHNCRGFVEGTTKVVYVPETSQSFWFDLVRDPDEKSPQPLTEALAKKLDAVHDLLAHHRTKTWLRRRDLMTRYPAWFCGDERACRPLNPKKPKN